MSLLPFPSFLDDVHEKGLRKAIVEGIDETVERITAGMNIQDIREAFRGDTPSRRPNPRLTPHAEGFWLHMRPGYFHKEVAGVYPTFRLGWLSVYFVFFETVTGIMLMFWYTPSPLIAYGNMLDILGNVPMGQFMRDLHRLGAEAMVLIVSLHMMRTWVTGSYKKPRQFTWFTGVLLLLFTGLLSFTGYLLPWDQLSLWAVTIGASMGEATPVIGAEVNLLIRGAPDLGANGLLRFYMAHVLGLPVFLFVFTGVHYYKVIIHGHSLPPQQENIGEDTAKRVPLDKRLYFIPDVLTNELLWAGVTTFIMVVLCIWFYHAPLEHHADPQSTPLGTTAPWYFLWIQGALKLGDKFIWGVVFPSVAIGALAVLPYLDVTPSRRYADRRIMLTVAMLTISVTTILSYMGLPEFGVATSAEREIIHEISFPPAHSNVGVALTVPFEQLVPGMYSTAQFDGDNPRAAIAEFNERINANNDVAHFNSNLRSRQGAWEFMTPYELLRTDLTGTAGNLSPSRIPENFSVVPDDAPELLAVLEELNEKLEKEVDELPDAWGGIVITENQEGLRRMDLVIFWDGVVIEEGLVQFDEETGEPIPSMLSLVEHGDGEYLEAVQGEDGTWTVPATGEGVSEDEIASFRERRIYVKHLFIHEDSAYFN